MADNYQPTPPSVNRDAFERVARALEAGDAITFEMIGDIFGKDFWIILVYTLLDAASAARAVDGAIRRLSGSKS